MDLDGYRRDDEYDAHRHQHRRHARTVHRPLSIHIAAFASDLHDDGDVTDDEDDSGEKRRQDCIQYGMHISLKVAEILTVLTPPAAVLIVDVDEHPQHVQVSGDQRAASDGDAGDHPSSGEEKMGFVRYEDDDETLDGHQHDDPRTGLREDVRSERIKLARDGRGVDQGYVELHFEPKRQHGDVQHGRVDDRQRRQQQARRASA